MSTYQHTRQLKNRLLCLNFVTQNVPDAILKVIFIRILFNATV